MILLNSKASIFELIFFFLVGSNEAQECVVKDDPECLIIALPLWE